MTSDYAGELRTMLANFQVLAAHSQDTERLQRLYQIIRDIEARLTEAETTTAASEAVKFEKP